jgi:asparagine synthase (glutamine-hydrolysing)
MCGLAGILNLEREGEISFDDLKKMIAMVRHRGPDGFGFYRDRQAGLAHARLSIIDLEGGWQPVHNEDKSVWIVFNGEIFNYRELHQMLEKKGHRFYTKSDTEVIVHLYEDHGPECLAWLNGQFSFAIWDKNRKKLFIARDRLGIRPLFYTVVDGSLLFASETKSLFTDSRVPRALDLLALDQTFTFWMPVPPRTAFENIHELPAGHYLTVERGKITTARYWDVDFDGEEDGRTEEAYAEELRELLIDSTRLQLRADVPVGAYLSGGIDSSVITMLIKKFTDTPLRTFSVTFADGVFDESEHQKKMIDYLGADHSSVRCTSADIGGIFPDVIWHTEKTLLRTAAAPLYLLAKLVRDSGYKVVLTGEGSDEILAGYDIFKEVKVRRFLERNPRSKFRSLILKRLYPYLANSPVKSLPYAESFFKADTSAYPAEFYSHIPRWNTTSMAKVFFSSELKNTLQMHGSIDDLSEYLSDGIYRADDISRAQYIEIKTLLPGYLLSSQGDRVAMAHSIEGRFPFLDHRLVEFCGKLPPKIRMRALTEKYILKKSMKGLIPDSILHRTKQPYMAPDAKSFFSGRRYEYVEELLSEKNLTASGLFNSKAVQLLAKKCLQSPVLGFRDNMAIVGILSTLLLQDLFIKKFDAKSEELYSLEMTSRVMSDGSEMCISNIHSS